MTTIIYLRLMLEITVSLAIVYAITYLLSRFGRLGTVIGMTLGSVVVAASHIIPTQGPTADIADLLGTMGLLVSMFLAGNAFDTKGVLKKAQPWLLIAGQMIGMTVLGALVGRWMGNLYVVGAFIIGFTMMQSSTNIVVDALKKRRWDNEPVGVLSLTLMVIQDIASGSMPLVIGLLIGSQGPGINLFWLAILLMSLGLLYAFGPKIGSELLNHERSPLESPFLLGLCVTLGIGVISLNAGVASASAAFFAGLMWRRTGFVSKTEAQMGLARDLLVPIFFISALRTADLSFASFISMQTWVFVIFEIVGTLLITYPLARLAGIGPMGSALLGIASAQAGEFTFLVVQLGTKSGLISGTEGGALAFASVITFVFSALASDYFESIYQKAKRFIGFFDRQARTEKIAVITDIPPSVIFLDVPEGTNHDVSSAVKPWVNRARKLWAGTTVLIVEWVEDAQEESFLSSLGGTVLVREPYHDPVGLLKTLDLSKTKVIISGPALGLRQDLELALFLNSYPKINLITVASNRTEADQLEKIAETNSRITVVNETRDLAANIGKAATDKRMATFPN